MIYISSCDISMVLLCSEATISQVVDKTIEGRCCFQVILISFSETSSWPLREQNVWLDRPLGLILPWLLLCSYLINYRWLFCHSLMPVSFYKLFLSIFKKGGNVPGSIFLALSDSLILTRVYHIIILLTFCWQGWLVALVLWISESPSDFLFFLVQSILFSSEKKLNQLT